MSLIISNIALHFLSKKEGSGEVLLRLGPENLAPEQSETSSKITAVVDGLHAIYNSKASKAYGSFTTTPMVGSVEGDNETASIQAARFVDLMESYFNEKQSFYDFSIQAANSLKNEIEKYDLEETGYLIVCHYEYMGGRFLIVGVIPVSEHYSVDGELNISAAQHLDVNKLQLAARIDLFDYQQNASGNRYISFIKGRAGRKVSDFFLDFLNCEEGVNPKQQSEVLVQAVDDFGSVNQLNPEEMQTTRKELLS